MQVKFGRQRWTMKTDPGSAGRARFEHGKAFQDEVRDQVFEYIANKVVMITPGILRDLSRRLDAAGDAASSRMTDKILSVIDGSDGGTGFSMRGGRINWLPLSREWREHKSQPPRNPRRVWRGNPANADKFFIHTGNLRSKLASTDFGAKFGGVSVRDNNRVRRVNGRQLAQQAARSADIALADIDIKIWPRLSPALIPMLSSRRWTATSRGFSTAVLGNTRNAKKLEGPTAARHRPLLQPIMQFWLIYQVPQAIKLALIRWLNTNQELQMRVRQDDGRKTSGRAGVEDFSG